MKAQSTGNSYKRGAATLEILIAFAVLTLSMGAVILLTFGNQSSSVSSQTNNEAIYRAQKMLEEARANSRFDFDLVNPVGQTPDDIYKKSLDVRQFDLFTKQATSTVSWNEGNRALSVTLSTLLTNPLGFNGGGTCSSVLSNPNGWKSPLHYEFSSVNFSGPNANGIAITDLDVFNKKLYVTAGTSPNPSPDTFFVLDLSDDPSQSPVLLGSIDNNPSSLTGINAVSVAGNYAYVANAYGANFTTCTPDAPNCSQLQIIDVSNPANPQVVKSIKIPGVTGNANQSIGTSVFYYNGYVYLGLAKSASGPEFNIIDVGGGSGGASPTNPIWKGGYSVGNGVNSIHVKGKYAYIATPNSENMTILDISNPISPTRVGGYSPSGGSNGKTVFSVGNTVYLGRTFGTNEFYILNASNPSNVSVTGSPLDIGSGSQTSIKGLMVRDYLAFFITPSQFQVWDISNPSNMRPWTSDGTTGSFLSMSILGGSGTATNCEGDRIYVAVASSQGNNKDILAVITPGAAKTTPTIAWADPSNIPYGTALNGTQLNAVSGGIAGTFTYTPSVGAKLNAGSNQTLSVRFVPTDQTSYDIPPDKIVYITVDKVDPTIAASIKNNGGATVTTVTSGTAVRHEATVTGIAGMASPTGTVNFTVSTTKTDCGSPKQSAGTSIALVAGLAKSSNYTTAGKFISFSATYNGDSNYNSLTSTCSALTVN